MEEHTQLQHMGSDLLMKIVEVKAKRNIELLERLMMIMYSKVYTIYNPYMTHSPASTRSTHVLPLYELYPIVLGWLLCTFV